MHAAFIKRSRADLEVQRDALLAELDGCRDETCPHHGDEVQTLDVVLWLLSGSPL